MPRPQHWVKRRGNYTFAERQATHPRLGTPSTLNDGLVSYFLADGTDVIGTQSLTAVNSPGTGTGQVGTCMDLERSLSQAYTIPDVSAAHLEPNQDLSISMWLKPESLFNYMILHAKTTGTMGRSYTGAAGSIITQWGGGSLTSSAGALQVGVWMHLYVNWDQSQSTLSRSIDNAALTTSVGAGATTTTTPFTIGSASSTNYFDGLVEQVAVWNRALTEQERDELWNNGEGKNFLPR